MAVKPISPREVVTLKASSIPDEVFEAFNELIAENFWNGYSSFTEKKVVARIVKKGISSTKAYENNWLDVEKFYEKAGWKVDYDKPGFNESYDAVFNFSIKKKS